MSNARRICCKRDPQPSSTPLYGEAAGYEFLALFAPVPLDHCQRCPEARSGRASPRPGVGPRPWRSAKQHGYRNAQATVIAPTGTIGLVMDCDTTGIEPDFALVKFKKLAGGGYFKIINRAVPDALRKAWLPFESEIAEIVRPMRSAMARWVKAPAINHGLPGRAKGFGPAELDKLDNAIEAGLKSAFDIKLRIQPVGRSATTSCTSVLKAFRPSQAGRPYLRDPGPSSAIRRSRHRSRQ